MKHNDERESKHHDRAPNPLQGVALELGDKHLFLRVVEVIESTQHDLADLVLCGGFFLVACRKPVDRLADVLEYLAAE